MTLTQAIATAKQKAAGNARWIRAIERADNALQSGELCVTLLAHDALVTSPRGSYRVNGHCECEAARRGHRECYHRAAVRLTEMLETETATSRPIGLDVKAARITRSVESNHTGVKYNVVRVDGWAI